MPTKLLESLITTSNKCHLEKPYRWSLQKNPRLRTGLGLDRDWGWFHFWHPLMTRKTLLEMK